MSRRLAVAALAGYIGFLAHAPVWSADRPSTVADSEAQALVTKMPESIDVWQARRPSLVGWVHARLGDASAKQPDWSASGEAVKRDECSWFMVRHGETECGSLLVPADHVGRGPAVIYFANGRMRPARAETDQESAESARRACLDLARAGYIVMLMHEAEATQTAKAPPQATTHADLKGVEFLLARREVDPDRVAVLGVGAAARRAWWAAAINEHLAGVVSLGTPDSGTLEDQVLISLIAPRPHRLALDAKRVREREPAYRRWVAGPQDVYDWCEVSRLFSTKVGAGFSSAAESPAWQDTLRWLKDEL